MQSQQEAQTPSLQPVAVVSDIVPRIRALMVELKMSLASVVKGAAATLAYQINFESDGIANEASPPASFPQSWHHFNAICDQLECLFISILANCRQNSECQKFTPTPVFRPEFQSIETSTIPPNAMSYQNYVQLVMNQTSLAQSTYEGFSEFVKQLDNQQRSQPPSIKSSFDSAMS